MANTTSRRFFVVDAERRKNDLQTRIARDKIVLKEDFFGSGVSE